MNSDDIRFVRSAMLTDWEGICSIKVSSTTPQSGEFFSFCFPLDQSPLLTSETSKNSASARKKFGATAIGTRERAAEIPDYDDPRRLAVQQFLTHQDAQFLKRSSEASSACDCSSPGPCATAYLPLGA